MSDLTTKQRKTIAALLSEPTIEAAAAKAGIGSNTIRRWKKECPAFAAELDAAETEAITDAARSIAAGAIEATEVLRAALKSDDEKERRLAAATLLGNMPNVRLLGAIEQKILELLEQQ